jgi:hypothetical protein
MANQLLLPSLLDCDLVADRRLGGWSDKASFRSPHGVHRRPECSDNSCANLTYNEASTAWGSDPFTIGKDGLDLVRMSLPSVSTGSTLVKMSVKRFRASSESESPFSQPS